MRSLTEVAPGVLVTTSSYELTTSTVVVSSSGGCLLIDPAVTVADLTALAGELAALGLRPAVGWSTHPHWDHVLWSRELGEAPRYGVPAAVTIAGTERDGILDEVRQSAPGHDLELVGRMRSLDASVIPWEGPEARLIVHDGHAPGHGAVFLPDSGVLIAGDMCSDVEIPLLDTSAADPLGDYRTGMERLASVPGVRLVVPGHGHVGGVGELRRRLALDAAYLDSVSEGRPHGDPRLTADSAQWMRDMHEEQVRSFKRLASARCGDRGTRLVRSGKSAYPERIVVLRSAAGSSSTDGCAASRAMSYCAGTRSSAGASTCPFPGLRAKRGWAPPATWSLIRCPRPNRWATPSRLTLVVPVSGSASVSRTMPSQTFRDRPRGSTSQSRTNRSACGLSRVTESSAATSPMTSTGSSSGSLLNTSTSSRRSMARLSRLPAFTAMIAPPADGVGSAGS